MKKVVFIVLSIILFVIIVVIALSAWYLYNPNVYRVPESGYYLNVDKDDSFDDIFEQLNNDNVLKHPATFYTVARYTKSDDKIKQGRYKIERGMNNHVLLQMLRNGLQTPLMFTFNNINYIEDFCGMAGRVLQMDSLQVLKVLRDEEFLNGLSVKPEMILGYMLPDSYEVYWTISPEGLIKRLVNESERFWQGERKQLLKQRGLNKDEVLIIASIIQKETNHLDEMPRMAGVYVNRLRRGIKLQADPTVKYAVGDLTLRRILYKHLETPSPYNTYYVQGLPPGVICAPNPATIDKVLNYEEHDLLFFCAEPGYNSRHVFAATNAQHERNRSRYHAWLRSEGIR